MRKALGKFSFFLHALSMDVAVGAVLMCFAFEKSVQLESPTYWKILLFNGTLLMYWFDHYLDNLRLNQVPSARHAIILKVQNTLIWVALGLVASSVIICILFFEPIAYFGAGLLILLMLVYLHYHKRLQRYLLLQKEFLVSVLYALSIVFPALITSFHVTTFISTTFIVMTASIVLLTLQNTLIIALLEHEQDLQFGIPNICTQFGKSRISLFYAVVGILFFIIFLISLRYLEPSVKPLSLMLFLIAFLHFIVYRFFGKKMSKTQIRFILELSFSITALAFLSS